MTAAIEAVRKLLDRLTRGLSRADALELLDQVAVLEDVEIGEG